jgi:hypothetical protein
MAKKQKSSSSSSPSSSSSNSNKKRARKSDVRLDDIATQAWAHYHNYLESCGNVDNDNTTDGDIDELQELLALTTPHVTKKLYTAQDSNPLQKWIDGEKNDSDNTTTTGVSALLPVLVSVTFYHLASIALSHYEYLQFQLQQIQQQQQDNTNNHSDEDEVAIRAAAEEKGNEVQDLVLQSLEYYPHNAASWSMGANFGKLSQRLSTDNVLQWYERAVQEVMSLQEVTLGLLDDDDDERKEDDEQQQVEKSKHATGGVPDQVKEWIELLFLHQILGIELVEITSEDSDSDEEEEESKGDDDDDDDNNNDKEEKDDSYFSFSSVEATARFMCAMLASTVGRHDQALTHLRHFSHLTHRLHPNVWQPPPRVLSSSPSSSSSSTTIPIPTATTTMQQPVAFRPSNGILPPHLYQQMLNIFGPKSAYWKESDYSSRGYYSYYTDLNHPNKKPPSNLLDEVIVKYLLPRAQQVLALSSNEQQQDKGNKEEESAGDAAPSSSSSSLKTICGYEWWVHTRPVIANLGHNLHFDTDESLLAQEGKIMHPILSSVLYLTSGSTDNTTDDGHVGAGAGAGATIILNQTPNADQVATSCWKSVPQDNTFMVFPGNLLHGVLPCRSSSHRHPRNNTASQGPKHDADNDKDVENTWESMGDDTLMNQLRTTTPDQNTPRAKEPQQQQQQQHRLTLMVGFWTRNVPATMKNRRLYGPCGPLPPNTDDHTWVHEITKDYQNNNKKKKTSKTTSQTRDEVAEKALPMIPLPMVSPAWELIQSSASTNSTDTGTSAKVEENGSLVVEEDAIYPLKMLQIPRAMDHHFFVSNAPQCFRDSLFEDASNTHNDEEEEEEEDSDGQ